MNEFKKAFTIVWDFSKDSLRKTVNETNKVITSGLKSIYKDVRSQLLGAITDAFKNSITELNSMLQYSQLSSAETRELAFGYGFSSAQAYAFEKALSAVGLDSIEDLYYANNLELTQFREAFTSYSDQYEELYDSGFFEDMQRYQYEMSNFRNEMQLEVIKFIMDNKDIIKLGMQSLLKISETLLNGFSWLVGRFGNTYALAGATDVINQYSEVKNNSNRVTINNEFNGVGKGDEATLANMGSLSYKQVIEALTGGSY